MKIGDRVKVIFGTQLRNEGFENMMPTGSAAKKGGYLHVWQEGIVVDISDGTKQLDQRIYHVHLDGDFRPDGSPDITVYEADAEGSLAEVVVLVSENEITEIDAANRVNARNESVNRAIDEHNTPILAEIATLEPERETILDQLQGVFIPKTNEQRDLIARSSELHVRIANLKQSLVKEHTK